MILIYGEISGCPEDLNSQIDQYDLSIEAPNNNDGIRCHKCCLSGCRLHESKQDNE